MSKKIIVSPPDIPKNKDGLVPSPKLIQITEGTVYNSGKPVIKFSFLDTKKYSLEKCQASELKDLQRFFIKIEGMTWLQIKVLNGLDYKEISLSDIKDPPQDLSPDVTIFQLRVSKKFRVLAFKYGDALNLISLVRNHDGLKGQH